VLFRISLGELTKWERVRVRGGKLATMRLTGKPIFHYIPVHSDNLLIRIRSDPELSARIRNNCFGSESGSDFLTSKKIFIICAHFL
jgi:hypothetical protein